MKVFAVLLNDFDNQYEPTSLLGVFRHVNDATRCMLNYLYQYNDTELDKESWIEANIHTDTDTLDAFNGEIYYEVCELM
jgi:hypothetical protein